jgi:hypothetical protein
MADLSGRLSHLSMQGRAKDRSFHRAGGGPKKILDVDVQSHGTKLRGDLANAYEAVDDVREEIPLTLEELNSTGAVLTLEATDAAFPLRLDSLERLSTHLIRRPKWLLLSVYSEEAEPERATIWVSDDYRASFLDLFEKFLTETTDLGKPKNRELVANIARIRASTLDDLWQSSEPPLKAGKQWWEVWLQPSDRGVILMQQYCEGMGLRLSRNTMLLRDRSIMWVEARWDDLLSIPFTAVPITELRRPEFVDTVQDLSRVEQDEYSSDLSSRIIPASIDAPAVCHLDTGVRRSHNFLQSSLLEADVHTVVKGSLSDLNGHGTMMAGLALLGPLDDLLVNGRTIELTHRLESVKILPDVAPLNDPSTYGLVTAQAVATPEAVSRRSRVFCMPVTAHPESPGEPTLWSASVDALAVGVDVGHSDQGIALLGRPDPSAARLFVISAGNVDQADFSMHHHDVSDTSPVQDPAQAWNALTVGAFTDLDTLPTDPSFENWAAVAERGDLSPHSRTSLLFGNRHWPIKPDICMEGGNVLGNGIGDFHASHPVVSLRTADSLSNEAIGSANATSAATAQAAGLAARAMAMYPGFWPESIRGLLTHAAEWTPIMRRQFLSETGRAGQLSMLRRFGWGVPTEENVLYSTRQSVTLVSQDALVPFAEGDFTSPTMRLHDLPWPVDQLSEMGGEPVSLRVTLSYFVEPSASRRGWRRRYSYPSHSLRFELKNPLESESQFLARVNRESEDDSMEDRPGSTPSRWLVGPNQRNLGSIHQDVWTGTGPELAQCGSLAVFPVGGWWKHRKDPDRGGMSARYSLIVSLRTPQQDVDLYTPIWTQLEVPVPALGR